MTIEIKSGSLSDFFESARETAKEIDEGGRVTPKNTIWVEPSDLIGLLRPERMKLIRYLRGKKKAIVKDIIKEMNRSSASLKRDIDMLSKYELVRMYKEKNPGDRAHNVVEPLFGSQRIEFKAEI